MLTHYAFTLPKDILNGELRALNLSLNKELPSYRTFSFHWPSTPVTHWLTWLGVIYILWLALKIARSQPANNTRSDVPLSFRTSFLLQFANVKIILYGVTALSTFVIPYTSSQVWIILISVLLALIGVFGNLCCAAAGHLFQALLRQHGRLVNRILAGALVLVAVDMLL